MAFEIGDEVHVPRKVLSLPDDVLPFYRTTVRDKQARSIRVDLPGGQLSPLIATSKVYRNFGVLIVRIGDYNEFGLLDPLAKSILQYCRMLISDDSVRLIELRTEDELATLWGIYHGMCEQVVLVGHGSGDGFLFGQQNLGPERLAEIFCEPTPGKKEFISLGCQTGLADFGKTFSEAECVGSLLAPFHSVHGCVASLFTQTYLNERILGARSSKVAFNHARSDLKGAASFRLWRNGTMNTGNA